jgi:hypothetical protein
LSEEKKLNTTFEKNKLYAYLGDDLVDTLKEYKAFIAGGLITSLFCNKEINDVDIYFRTREDAAEFIRDEVESSKVVTYTTKATTFLSGYSLPCQAIYFQSFDSAQDIFGTFDFTVCMGAFDFEKEEFVLHDDFIKHNSQRILKFNYQTSFPLISALRVDKYKNKGYNISKAEFVKILLAVNKLNITSLEQLKDQIGGMYGANYDALFEGITPENFSLDSILEKISELTYEETYFNDKDMNENTKDKKLPPVEDLYYLILGSKPQLVKTKDNRYYRLDDDFSSIIIDSRDEANYDITPIEKLFKSGTKVYKWVKQDGNKLYSFHDKNFEYKIGTVAIPKNPDTMCSGIYASMLDCIKSASYCRDKGSVLLELSVLDPSDLLHLSSGSSLRFARLEVMGVVSEGVIKGEEKEDFISIALSPKAATVDYDF